MPFAAPPGGLLAGPVLRRADREHVRVWVCTLGPVRPALWVYRASVGPVRYWAAAQPNPCDWASACMSTC